MLETLHFQFSVATLYTLVWINTILNVPARRKQYITSLALFFLACYIISILCYLKGSKKLGVT